MRLASAFVIVSLLVVACAKTTAPTALPTESLHVPSVASASAAAGRPAPPEKKLALPDVPNAVSWTDPEIVQRLAADCRWRPSDLDRASEEQRNPLSCTLQFIQSCNPDPCFEENESVCKPQCAKTCSSCAGACTSSCESCKSTCADDACRLACAERCAGCRDACVRAVDRCQTATCGDETAACNKAVAAELKRPACKAACQRAMKCAEKCGYDEGREGCREGCEKAFAGTCMEKLFEYCAAGP